MPRRLDLQAAEAERCLRDGLLESPVVPLDESVAVMETLDLVRGRLDLTAAVPRGELAPEQDCDLPGKT